MNRRDLFRVVAGTGIAMTAIGATAPAFAETMAAVSSGTFEGRSNHINTGSVQVFTKGGRTFVELGDDFDLDGGPDPRVALGKNGEYVPEGYLGALIDLKGKQLYALPTTLAVDEFDSVVIWCEVAQVPLGVATLS